ncbi:MAG: ImmA/IrrE family metallo-endopeptidase [Actinomycetota bacterium]
MGGKERQYRHSPTRHLATDQRLSFDHGTALRRLRRLLPDRPLTAVEAFAVAERQASLLLAIWGVEHLEIPIEMIGELSAVTVQRMDRIPVAGASFWTGANWVIVVDTACCHGHRRLTLAHEFKHVIDHRPEETYHDPDLVESVADFFARCALAPRSWVKTEISRGVSDVAELAARFGLPIEVMARRLDELGLADQVRAARPLVRWLDRSRCARRGC